MGQRLSRTTTTTTPAAVDSGPRTTNSTRHRGFEPEASGQIEAQALGEQTAAPEHRGEADYPVFSVSSCSSNSESSLALMNNNSFQQNQLIIKIQLTKMDENGLDNSSGSGSSSSIANQNSGEPNSNGDSLNNSIVNLNLNSEIVNESCLAAESSRTAGSSLVQNHPHRHHHHHHRNNNNNNNSSNNSSNNTPQQEAQHATHSNSKRLHSEVRHREDTKVRAKTKTADDSKDTSHSAKKAVLRQKSKSSNAASTQSSSSSSTTAKHRDSFFKRLLDTTTASITSSSSSSSSASPSTSLSTPKSAAGSTKKSESSASRSKMTTSHKEKSQHSNRSSSSTSSRNPSKKRPTSSLENAHSKDRPRTSAAVLTAQQQPQQHQTPQQLQHQHQHQSEQSSCSALLPAGQLANNIVNITATTTSGNNVIDNSVPICIAAVSTVAGSHSASNALTTTSANQLSICTICREDLIIPITHQSPQVVLVQCNLGRLDHNAIRLTTTELGNVTAQSLHNGVNSHESQIASGASQGNGGSHASSNTTNATNSPIVHSQVDFVHCLVPDLDKIFNCSYYWGTINRYQAESLLEGKPEGTFLLRDSAQEEFLFSVTFRKYGRSLHARIEQMGHMFSFDCHDPSVFTAPTVTSLIQHYKDPACVMFFEPMLTIPLHRKNPFSLQELARAAIVSNTSYDGINKLELPVRLKSYLKEYHYKQRVRVKPFDEPFYGCTT